MEMFLGRNASQEHFFPSFLFSSFILFCIVSSKVLRQSCLSPDGCLNTVQRAFAEMLVV